MAPGHEVQRLAIGVVLAVNAGDFEAAEMLVDAMDPAEQRAVILALGQLTDSGVRGRAGSPEAARSVLETFARELASGSGSAFDRAAGDEAGSRVRGRPVGFDNKRGIVPGGWALRSRGVRATSGFGTLRARSVFGSRQRAGIRADR